MLTYNIHIFQESFTMDFLKLTYNVGGNGGSQWQPKHLAVLMVKAFVFKKREDAAADSI